MATQKSGKRSKRAIYWNQTRGSYPPYLEGGESDPQWDIRFGLPRQHLIELLVTGEIRSVAQEVQGNGGHVHA